MLLLLVEWTVHRRCKQGRSPEFGLVGIQLAGVIFHRVEFGEQQQSKGHWIYKSPAAK